MGFVVEARKALAIEHRRRGDWRERERPANTFAAKCGHANDARLPHGAHDLVT